MKIAVKDIGTDDYFSYNNGIIIYNYYQPDERWGNKISAISKCCILKMAVQKR